MSYSSILRIQEDPHLQQRPSLSNGNSLAIQDHTFHLPDFFNRNKAFLCSTFQLSPDPCVLLHVFCPVLGYLWPLAARLRHSHFKCEMNFLTQRLLSNRSLLLKSLAIQPSGIHRKCYATIMAFCKVPLTISSLGHTFHIGKRACLPHIMEQTHYFKLLETSIHILVL